MEVGGVIPLPLIHLGKGVLFYIGREQRMGDRGVVKGFDREAEHQLKFGADGVAAKGGNDCLSRKGFFFDFVQLVVSAFWNVHPL